MKVTTRTHPPTHTRSQPPKNKGETLRAYHHNSRSNSYGNIQIYSHLFGNVFIRPPPSLQGRYSKAYAGIYYETAS